MRDLLLLLSPLLVAVGCQASPEIGETNSAATIVFPGHGIDNYGGQMMTTCVDVYFIWYGQPQSAARMQVLNDLVNLVGGTPYYNMVTTYYDGSGGRAGTCLHVARQTTDSGSQGVPIGSPADAAETSVLLGVLPRDPNGIYVVVTSPEANLPSEGWTNAYHGHRSDDNLKYIYLGTAPADAGTLSPNHDVGADAAAWLLMHEIFESVTDPYGQAPIDSHTAWYSATGGEAADICENDTPTFYYTDDNLAPANLHVGARDFWLPPLWLNSGDGSCEMSYPRRPDDLLCNQNGNVWIAFSKGGNTGFTNPPAVLSGWCSGAGQVLTGDWNGDGKTDLWCHATDTSGNNWIISSNGSGFQNSRQLYPGCASPSNRLLAGDVDGDGKTDLICNNLNTGLNMVSLTADANGEFFGPQLSGWCAGSDSRILTADLNGDGKSDLVCYSNTTGNTWVAYSNGNGFTNGGQILSGFCIGASTEMLAGDFGALGRQTLLCHDTATGRWQFGQPPSYGPLSQIFSALCYGPNRRLLVADVNYDLYDDLVCNRGDNGDNTVKYNSKNGFYSELTPLHSWCYGAGSRIAAGDFNGVQPLADSSAGCPSGQRCCEPGPGRCSVCTRGGLCP